MPTVALEGGHAGFGVTPGKRTPAGEYEWDFNNKVVLAAIKYLNEYENVKIIRLDDPTGRRDIPLKERTDKANKAKADVLISMHHNANTGKWGNWTGTETYHYPNSASGLKLARAIHPRLCKAYGIHDRGIKSANFHMLRESNMPAVLPEGGFMDSTIDIHKLRNDKVLDDAGKAIAEGVAEYLSLKKKVVSTPPKKEVVTVASNDIHKVSDWAKESVEIAKKLGITDGTRMQASATREEIVTMLVRALNLK
ncbi:MAG TPA: N-acetylmuramoyl-L-alanine amidase [Candidatus Nitrosocosmicus sp.]|nr:N-acetylmuramoyl-L-alanine amidase [Candidatus Nitrosocosmicus sp.]